MAETNEPFHVPQQNRRNKLRVVTVGTHQDEQALMHGNFPQSSNIIPQGLSLSLSFQHQDNQQISLEAQRNNGNPILEGLLKQNTVQMRNSVPLGPFTGYASVLTSSRYLKPAQQILNEFLGLDYEVSDFPLEILAEDGADNDSITCSDKIQHRWKNSRLILLLDEVYRKYKLYCQQMQSVVASFKCVSGLGNAAPYVCFAFKAVASHFSCLKNAILDQIRFADKACGVDKRNVSSLWTSDQGINNQNSIRNSIFLTHPLWRSQRGLPEHAVAVLKTWLFEHFLHPYPSDSEKLMLAQQTGLSRTQVSNWFINARVRLWKPMVEEVHNLELRQAHIQTPSSEATNQDPKLPHFIARQEVQNIQTKRPRNNVIYNEETELQKSSSYIEQIPSNHHNVGVVGTSSFGLALGLNQNNGVEFGQLRLPMNLYHNFSFGSHGELSSKPGFDVGRQ
ncbi:Mitochondrial substrate carrier family protein isoform 1 [Hibiscus syriacus]|uniref:Mitochondrial substrate carrier family protein isoform 1 n=1 Tax=Hibiscus syriacus TaxID=106335 RepID=A0A6A2X949_HIBSY|nr:BEL1-like homeodomain protein 9 [Hibiscus syriacus]KAE8671943.1 Mitochondrial substrate carrier family protein isoform 1 [Hibiscus syriacus]